MLDRSFQAVAEIRSTQVDVVAFGVREDVVLVLVRNRQDVLDLAIKLGMPRVIRSRRIIGFLHGVRTVVWYEAAPVPVVWPETQTTRTAHHVWPSTGVTSIDRIDEDTHDRRRRRRGV
jgi:hypothetical protein